MTRVYAFLNMATKIHVLCLSLMNMKCGSELFLEILFCCVVRLRIVESNYIVWDVVNVIRHLFEFEFVLLKKKKKIQQQLSHLSTTTVTYLLDRIVKRNVTTNTAIR